MPRTVILDPFQEAARDRPVAVQQEDRLAWLCAAWHEGVESGDDRPLDALMARYADPDAAEA